jgi:hypothetical protein
MQMKQKRFSDCSNLMVFAVMNHILVCSVSVDLLTAVGGVPPVLRV